MSDSNPSLDFGNKVSISNIIEKTNCSGLLYNFELIYNQFNEVLHQKYELMLQNETLSKNLHESEVR